MNVRRRILTTELTATTAEVDWAAVYAEQLPRVYNYFCFKGGAGPLAEDLTAQTFEQAWRGRGRYRRDLGAFATWLFTIARNVAVSHFRQRRDRDVPLDDLVTQPHALALDDIVLRRGDLARLRVLLAQLPARERELIELKYGTALTNRAIAALTGLGESHVGVLLHRTVRRLRAAWEEEPA